jgi:hypothetical protein
MKKRSITSAAVILIALTGLFSACDKNNDRTRLDIHLTDNPYNAQQVNVDIKEVRVNMTSDSAGWQTIQTIPGVYNLLDLQNGIDTLIASGDLPTGKLKEIRFILGSENSIMIDSIIHPLTIPSGSESGLKIKLNKDLRVGMDEVVIDFDAALSVHKIDEENYHLKPVLKIK